MAAPPRGFTLLEAIVALAIFSAGAMALYGLFSANMLGLMRARDVTGQIPIVEQAVERISLINPHRQAQGEFQLGSVDVAWDATLLAPLRQSQNIVGFMGSFEVGLYQVDFEISEDERLLGVWQMRLVGYEIVRANPFPAMQ